MNDTPKSPRWKLLIVLLALPWLAVLLLDKLPVLDRFSYMLTVAGMGAVFGTLLVVLFWLICFSRLRRPLRWKGAGLIIVVIALAAAMVRKDGHMGDFLPQLAWRWQARPGEGIAPLAIHQPASDGYRFSTDQPGDSSRFLGPNGTNDFPAGELPGNWHASPPRELWRREVGLGWSSFAVAGDFAITQEQRGDDELTVAYHRMTGEPLWQHAEKARFEESMGGNGPRSTPTAHDGRVYALGATGILLCLEGKTGNVIWRRDTLKDAGHENLMWAKSCSPLIAGDKIIITLGKGAKSLAAYSMATGEPAWRSGPDNASYGSPVLIDAAGVPQVLTVFADRATANDPATGAEIWSWTDGFKGAPANVANPVFIPPDRVLVGIGYGVGSTLLKTARGTPPEILWQSLKMKPKFTNFVVRGQRAWGLDEGRLSCLDLTTGGQLWRGSSYGHGQMLGAGDTLIIQTERGDVVVAAASEKDETILTRFPALTSKTWNQPCLAGRLLLVRNDREAVCFELGPATK